MIDMGEKQFEKTTCHYLKEFSTDGKNSMEKNIKTRKCFENLIKTNGGYTNMPSQCVFIVSRHCEKSRKLISLHIFNVSSLTTKYFFSLGNPVAPPPLFQSSSHISMV
eukprot:TRINITY_DN7996_c0_g2_i1.p2 TRINITY_DN7996_c0_g2~~TRINITY_DN7996_c0_g2_i1.p2  ORF type:complete len:108 (-),score=2.63 TRINITY_DN7996_c0_g2_i1:646-969(-)